MTDASSIVRQSPDISRLASALVLAQSAVRGAKKDAENPHFKSKYADLASVWDACREALHEQHIAVMQMPGYDATTKCVILTTRLLHVTGEWIESVAGAPIEERATNAQGVGSAVTYLRRYALASMVGVVTDDDDGNAASQAPKAREKRPAHVSKDGELVLPGDAKHWGGDGGKSLAKASDKALIACRNWHQERGLKADLIVAINEELERRRIEDGADSAPGDRNTPRPTDTLRQQGAPEKRSAPVARKADTPNPGATDSGRADLATLPEAVQLDDLIASVDRALRDEQYPKQAREFCQKAWRKYVDPTREQCEGILRDLEAARTTHLKG